MDEPEVSKNLEDVEVRGVGPPNTNHNISILQKVGLSACFFIFGFTMLIFWNAVLVKLMFLQGLVKDEPNIHAYFSASVVVCSMIPLLMANLSIMTFFYRFERYVMVIICHLLPALGLIIIFICVITEQRNLPFFIAMVISTFLMNFATPFHGAAYYSAVGFFPSICLTFFIAGQAFSGLLTTSFDLILIAIHFEDEKTSAIIFFSVPTVFTFISFFLSWHLSHSVFMKGHNAEDKTKVDSLKVELQDYFRLLKLKYIDVLSLFLTTGITLLYIPNLLTSIASTSSNVTWSQKYYFAFGIFFVFSLGDFLGRYVSLILPYPKIDSLGMYACSAGRFLFLPLYLLCNIPKYPSIPHPLQHDSIPVIMNFLLGLSNGHLLTIQMGSPYTLSDSESQKRCSKLFVFTLHVGLTVGAFSGFIFSK